MKLTRAQVGALLLVVMVGTIGLVIWWLSRPDQVLTIKTPNTDTCYSNQPIKISWEYPHYAKRVRLSFVSEADPGQVIRVIGTVANNPNGETSYNWRPAALLGLENKRGHIKIEGGISAISDAPFLISAPPPPKLTILTPNTDTCFSNQPIRISWNYRGYQGKVKLSFVSETDQTVSIKDIGIRQNIPGAENELIWDVANVGSVQNKKGYIKITGTPGGSSEISDMPFVICTPPPPMLRNLLSIPSFKLDDKSLTIFAIDTLLNNRNVDGIVYLNNTAIGKTNEPIFGNIMINLEEILNNCQGVNSATQAACVRYKTFVRINTDELTVKAPNYHPLKLTPVQTTLLADPEADCNCAMTSRQQLVQLDREFYLRKQLKPVAVKTIEKYYIPRQERSLKLTTARASSYLKEINRSPNMRVRQEEP